jgi:glyoxylase-like metal-dependent hydrolase (beta-lactamase superfamily II)
LRRVFPNFTLLLAFTAMSFYQVRTFVFGNMHTNAYVLSVEDGRCLIVDCGCNDDQERALMGDYVRRLGTHPSGVLLTHGHFDHTMGVAWLCRCFGMESYLHPGDVSVLNEAVTMGRAYHVQVQDPLASPHRLLDTPLLELDGFEIQVIHLPGHTPGSVAFYLPRLQLLFSGDTLTRGSLGFLNVSYQDFLPLLRERILTLPDETRVYCGHGAPTTLGEEKQSNLFFRKCLTA